MRRNQRGYKPLTSKSLDEPVVPVRHTKRDAKGRFRSEYKLAYEILMYYAVLISTVIALLIIFR